MLCFALILHLNEKYTHQNMSLFSRAASPERSDLSSHYGVCMYVCVYGCSLVEIFFTKGIFLTPDLA